MWVSDKGCGENYATFMLLEFFKNKTGNRK